MPISWILTSMLLSFFVQLRTTFFEDVTDLWISSLSVCCVVELILNLRCVINTIRVSRVVSFHKWTQNICNCSAICDVWFVYFEDPHVKRYARLGRHEKSGAILKFQLVQMKFFRKVQFFYPRFSRGTWFAPWRNGVHGVPWGMGCIFAFGTLKIGGGGYTW